MARARLQVDAFAHAGARDDHVVGFTSTSFTPGCTSPPDVDRDVACRPPVAKIAEASTPGVGATTPFSRSPPDEAVAPSPGRRGAEEARNGGQVHVGLGRRAGRRADGGENTCQVQ